MTHFPENVRNLPHLRHEREIAHRIIKNALALGCEVSVNDGEDEVVTRSTNIALIEGAMFSTEEEHLIFHKDGKRQGWCWLIWGNGYEALCDYTDSLETQKIVQPAIDYWEAQE